MRPFDGRNPRLPAAVRAETEGRPTGSGRASFSEGSQPDGLAAVLGSSTSTRLRRGRRIARSVMGASTCRTTLDTELVGEQLGDLSEAVELPCLSPAMTRLSLDVQPNDDGEVAVVVAGEIEPEPSESHRQRPRSRTERGMGESTAVAVRRIVRGRSSALE